MDMIWLRFSKGNSDAAKLSISMHNTVCCMTIFLLYSENQKNLSNSIYGHLPEIIICRSTMSACIWGGDASYISHLTVWEEWADGVLTGFIRVIVVGLLLLLCWRRLLSGWRCVVASGLPPLLSHCRRRSVFRRTWRVRASISCHWTYNHIQLSVAKQSKVIWSDNISWIVYCRWESISNYRVGHMIFYLGHKMGFQYFFYVFCFVLFGDQNYLLVKNCL